MIGIVTVLYNSAEVLPAFFASLSAQSFKDFRLYAVDNASSDDSADLFLSLSKEREFSSVLIRQQENGGVAQGNNVGIRAALADQCDQVLLSNNDIVMPSDCLASLIEGKVRLQAQMAVGKAYYYHSGNRLWYAGGYFRYWAGPAHRYYGEVDHGQADTACLVTYAPTCFMLVDASVFTKTGMMDERYFVYWDDTDFVWRAVMQDGFRLAYIPSSVLEHRIGFSSGGELSAFSLRYLNRNRVYFRRKNYGWFHRCCAAAYEGLSSLILDEIRLNRQQRNLVRQARKEGRKM